MSQERRAVLGKVQAVNRSQLVYDALVSAILDGRLPQGSWLRELRLAEDLGVSSTPVREALTRLINDGLAEHLPGRGVRVVRLDRRDIAEVYDLRAALECLAVRLCVASRSPEDVSRLSRLLEEMNEVRRRGKIAEYRRRHMEWHGVIMAIAGNHRLQEAFARIQLHVDLLVSTTVDAPGEPDRSAREHQEILREIAAGNAHQAETLMYAHIQSAKDELLEKYSDAEPPKGR
ncbi:GntR family transcriptional regulator [Limnochorda pilosa]|uniref:GntR family transcriptional regulator n=1 Tax=Limnochorda pilosa TaxID=1555112 RepID=A0A0K2SHF8_LIMPI|nr:GntR family transcriptional regulator [Limnochorda pilosa]BAS26249.1 GntR family transcriptional regulator [Limnochorda pilosa]